MIFSRRMNGMGSAIFTILNNEKKKLLAQGNEVFDFGMGTPDIPVAPHIIKAMKEAVELPENYKYAIQDLPELIDAVIDWYAYRYGVSLEKNEVMSLAGSQDGLAHISLTLANEDDIILVPDPGYPIFTIGPSLASLNIYKVPLIKEKNYLISFDDIEHHLAQAAKLMVVSYPNNPVTAIAPDDFYEKLIWFAKKNDIVIVHDNAYSELVFDRKKCKSFLSYPGSKEVGVEFNSLSKSYCMSGCRIAFAMGNRKIVERLRALKSHIDYGIFIPVQKAAIAALTGPQDYLKIIIDAYQKRRDCLVEGLNGMGWKVDKPPATMFVWSPIPNGYPSSMAFVLELMNRTGIITIPGSAFGEMGEGYVRFALVNTEAIITRALDLLRNTNMI